MLEENMLEWPTLNHIGACHTHSLGAASVPLFIGGVQLPHMSHIGSLLRTAQ